MKHFGNYAEYIDERNRDLMQVYRGQLKQCKVIVLQDVFRKVVNMPARRFYVSEDRAAIVIATMLKGDKLRNMQAIKREMYEEIFSRFKVLQHKFPMASIMALVSEIISQPAPKFYLKESSAKVIVYRIKKGWYEKRKLRY